MMQNMPTIRLLALNTAILKISTNHDANINGPGKYACTQPSYGLGSHL